MHWITFEETSRCKNGPWKELTSSCSPILELPHPSNNMVSFWLVGSFESLCCWYALDASSGEECCGMVSHSEKDVDLMVLLPSVFVLSLEPSMSIDTCSYLKFIRSFRSNPPHSMQSSGDESL